MNNFLGYGLMALMILALALGFHLWGMEYFVGYIIGAFMMACTLAVFLLGK